MHVEEEVPTVKSLVAKVIDQIYDDKVREVVVEHALGRSRAIYRKPDQESFEYFPLQMGDPVIRELRSILRLPHQNGERQFTYCGFKYTAVAKYVGSSPSLTVTKAKV